MSELARLVVFLPGLVTGQITRQIDTLFPRPAEMSCRVLLEICLAYW